MLDEATTERLIALLHAQRDEAGWRSALTRNTRAWTASTDRLDDINHQIMRVGAGEWGGLDLERDTIAVPRVRDRRISSPSVRVVRIVRGQSPT